VSDNAFTCPYPGDFPATVVLLRTPCKQPWATLGIYAGILVAAVALLIGLAKFLQHMSIVSAESLQFGVWLSLRAFELLGLISDIVAIVSILAYLNIVTDNCVQLNRYELFQSNLRSVWASQPIPPASTLFSEWFSSYRTFGSVSSNDYRVQLNLQSFTDSCLTLPECGLDVLGTTCVQLNPTLATTGGAQFTTFRQMVIAVAIVRAFIVTVRTFFVLLSCWQKSLVANWVGAELARSAFAAPVLYFASANRKEFLARVVFYDPTPGEHLFRLFHVGVLSSFGMLAVNLYYMLTVTQVGMTTANWLALINCCMLAPLVCARAALAWWRQQREPPLQEHARPTLTGSDADSLAFDQAVASHLPDMDSDESSSASGPEHVDVDIELASPNL
jgi:hypothetical protein